MTSESADQHDEELEARIRIRRANLGDAADGCQDERWGLALSGGGVRSATFCYGVITALARSNAFRRFDLMSTVSGGGYIGAMVGRLAHSLENSAELQQRLAQGGAVSKERDWLRSNSRYLIPRGSRDWLFAMVTFVRNLIGVHIELSVICILLGCLLGGIDLAAWWAFDQYIAAANESQIPARLQQWELIAPWPTLWLALPLPLLAAIGAAAIYWYLPFSVDAIGDAKRHKVTDWLARALQWVAIILALGLIDWVAWRIANKPSQLLVLGTAFAALLTMLRTVLPLLQGSNSAIVGSMGSKLPAIIDVAGRIGIFALVLFWTSVVHALLTRRVWNPTNGQVDFQLAAVLVGSAALAALAWVVVSGRSLEFLNRSSLHYFYRSRLTRTYLGAANPDRSPDSKVTDTAEGDDMRFSAYEPHTKGGPVHLINVCVNQTYQRHGLFNLDRQGELMSLIGPDWLKVEKKAGTRLHKDAPETLGTWIGVSGAAAAPGLGSLTRPGYAAMLTTLGIRLGYWWDSLDATKTMSRTGRTLPKYTYLLSELLARLPGSGTRIQYLSDGGHSENTGAYPLLEARCRLIVLADCGADPDYHFADLENLIRRARIDLDADIRFVPPDGSLPPSFGTLDDLASPKTDACLAVATIAYRDGSHGVLVVVKPNLVTALPEDVYNYSRDNPLFPQQTTADQFFDEDQWESYFALGQHLGGMLNEPLLVELAKLSGAKRGAPVAATRKNEEASGRRPLRLEVRAAATTTLGLGAILATVTGLWTAFQNSAIPTTPNAQDGIVMRSLYETYAAVPLADSDQSGPAVAKMAAQVMAQWKAMRVAGQQGQLESSKEALEMLQITASLCRPLRDRYAACHTFVQSFDCPAAPAVKTPVAMNYGYWARREPGGGLMQSERRRTYCDEGADLYGRFAMENTVAPADSIVVASTAPKSDLAKAIQSTSQLPKNADSGAAVKLPATDPTLSPDTGTSSPLAKDSKVKCNAPPVTQVCKGVNIFMQIYGGDGRDNVRALRTLWRAAGASVPPIEDVNDSARRQGRNPPTPYTKATVIYHQPALAACAKELATLACQSEDGWEVTPLPERYVKSPSTIEVWLPPATVATGFGQWATSGGYCYQEATSGPQGETSYGVHCHPSMEACKEARGPNPRRIQSGCAYVHLSGRGDLVPFNGWAGSRYAVANVPFGAPFPTLNTATQSESK